MEDPFLITAGVALIFYCFFYILLIFLQTFDVFQLLGQIWGFLSNVGYVSLWEGPFGTFEYGRLEDQFLNTTGVALIF